MPPQSCSGFSPGNSEYQTALPCHLHDVRAEPGSTRVVPPRIAVPAATLGIVGRRRIVGRGGWVIVAVGRIIRVVVRVRRCADHAAERKGAEPDPYRGTGADAAGLGRPRYGR